MRKRRIYLERDKHVLLHHEHVYPAGAWGPTGGSGGPARGPGGPPRSRAGSAGGHSTPGGRSGLPRRRDPQGEPFARVTMCDDVALKETGSRDRFQNV
jgi:hypothetical protein